MSDLDTIPGFKGAGPYPGMREYRKTKTALAIRMTDPFTVATPEGDMRGKAGDYLMMGAHGERYICDAAIFEDTYEAVDPVKERA